MEIVQQTAQYVLELRQRYSPMVTQGDVLSRIGGDGLQEAIQRRWLVPDLHTGQLMVNLESGPIETAKRIAQDGVLAESCENTSAGVALQHAFRNVLHEVAAPGTGKPGPALTSAPTPTTPAAPAAPATAAAPPAAAPSANAPAAVGGEDTDDIGVGDDVQVVESGRTYTGKVSRIGTDGQYIVSFGPERKARAYAPNELRRK